MILFFKNPKSNIIITGDFNDYHDNKSINEVLSASQKYEQIEETQLYNLSSYLYKSKNIGSHKYQGEWGVLDQFIVSGNFLNNENKIFTSLDDIHIFNADFLLEPDEVYFGFTYQKELLLDLNTTEASVITYQLIWFCSSINNLFFRI